MPAIRGQRTRSSRPVKRPPRIPTLPDVPVTLMLGCSTSDVNDYTQVGKGALALHGGTEVWDGWRTYTETNLYNYANRTGNQRPKFMCYSKSGANLGGTSPTYTAVFNEVKADLDAFYYTGGATSTTHATRWGIQLYWSNGNENSDKGALGPSGRSSPGTAQNVAGFVASQQGLYDAVHFIETNAGPTQGQRRYPDAFAGSDPTQNHEFNDIVQEWLYPSAPWHDFVVWSMYPPGRQPGGGLSEDPTYNWPSFNDVDWDSNPEGFLIRCYRRTKLAEAFAGHPLLIACGEVGIGDDPNDNTHRPYYAVYGIVEGCLRLGEQYSLTNQFLCWWDNQSSSTSAQNILSDEDPATTPTTREAWQGWALYNAYRGGTKPGSWATNPKANWTDPGGPGAEDTGTPL